MTLTHKAERELAQALNIDLETLHRYWQETGSEKKAMQEALNNLPTRPIFPQRWEHYKNLVNELIADELLDDYLDDIHLENKQIAYDEDLQRLHGVVRRVVTANLTWWNFVEVVATVIDYAYRPETLETITFNTEEGPVTYVYTD